MYQCTTCLKEFTTERSYAGHRSSHNRFNPSYLANRKKEKVIIDIVQPKKECNYCGKQFINGWQLGGHKVSCERKHRRELLLSSMNSAIQVNEVNVNTTSLASSLRRHTDESKSKISESMKLAHEEGRAWNIGRSRWNNEKSYPEKFFTRVIENEFEDKNYSSEFNVGNYSIDFAWVDKKLAIEIDGDQHLRFQHQIDSDIRKDKLLTSEGWKVLRIRWKDMCKDTKKHIQIAKSFVH